MAIHFAFAVPAGTPDKDVSTVSNWRVSTGPYMISSYLPNQQITLTRNPNFKQWTPDTPNGHLDRIQITIGTQAEQAMNEIADGQLDWYFEAVPTDRLAALQRQYPSQVHVYPRNDITYFLLNTRKAPMNNLKVRQALNYAVNRDALLKIFGGQGTPTENIIPPSLGPAFQRQWPYPYDLAKAKRLVRQSGTQGMAVQVWSHSDAPAPQAAQYVASVLDSLGYKATVKTLSQSVYWDTISTQKGDPQVAFVQFDQDYPEGQDFIDVQLNGQNITNVGNQNTSNINIPALNQQIDAAKAMPLGAARDAMSVKLDQRVHAERAIDLVHQSRPAEVRQSAAAWPRVQRHLLRDVPEHVDRQVSSRRSDLIASIGDNCIDVSLPGLDGADEDALAALVPASGLAPAELPGGNAFNVATVLARSGLSAAYLGAVGDDAAAELILGAGASAGVDMSRVMRVAGPTGRTVVGRDTHGERHFVFEDYGAAARYRLDDETIEWLTGARWLHFARQPDVAQYTERLRAGGATVSCDVGYAGGLDQLGEAVWVAWTSCSCPRRRSPA